MRWMTLAFVMLLTLSIPAPAGAQQESAPKQNAPPATPAQGSNAARPFRIRVGNNVAAAKLVSQVQPTYPPLAIQAHISGTVTLHAVIGTDGTVKTLDLVSGPQILVGSAMEAVKQWRYQPTLLNGQPVEVDTRIIVVYELSGGLGQQTPSVLTGPDATAGPSSGPSTDSQATDSQSQAIDLQFRADILKLIDAMHIRETEQATVRNMYQTMRPMILRTLPDTPNREKIADEYGEKLGALLSSPDVTDALVGIYAKSLSDDDIKALTAFYATPAGQHFLAAEPQIAGDSSRLGMRIASQHILDIFHQLCSEFPELQGRAGFCPANNKEKKSQLDAPIPDRMGD